jgi:P-type Ca2+ transporter type 2C
MIYASASSLALLLAVLYIPFLRTAFNTVPLGVEQWIVMLLLIFVPAIAVELTKLVLRRRPARAGLPPQG